LIFTTIMLWRTRFRHDPRFWLAAAGLCVLIVAAGLYVAGGRIYALPRIVASFIGGEAIADNTTNIRLALYHAGWPTFLEAPWFGHGWARLMSSILPYVDPNYLDYAKNLPQLHNDVLNFAVAGGIVGVGVYLLIVFTPLIAAIASERDSLRSARIYATGGLAIVYIGGGITDLMFGHEYHTMLFVMLNAIVLGLVREQPRDATASA
jgi:O-antigen ligase